MTLTHYDLCYGCGLANLFGLQMELERDGDGVAGRFFVKQDHQGPPGRAHGGIVAAALDEAMGMAVTVEGVYALTGSLEVDFQGPAPIGTFVRVEARIDRRDGKRLWTTARALGGEGADEPVAEARAVFVVRGERPAGRPDAPA